MVKNRALHLGLNQIKPNPAIVTGLPRDIEQRYHVLPITEADGKVTVAMANPEDPEASQAVVSLLGNSVYLVHADMDVIDKIRLKAKPHLDAEGVRATHFEAGRHYWLEPRQLQDFLDPQINDHQAKRVNVSDRGIIRMIAAESMQHFGYD